MPEGPLAAFSRPRRRARDVCSVPAGRWEIGAAWLLRVFIVGTAAAHVAQGKYLYALLCVVVIALLVAPPLLARSSRANVPIELELLALWGAVGDMTLGRLADLYGGTVWFDKALHFGNSVLIGIVAFLFVYALRFTGRLRTSVGVDALVILLLALGIGALWEIAEYVADLVFAEGARASGMRWFPSPRGRRPAQGTAPTLERDSRHTTSDHVGGLCAAPPGGVVADPPARAWRLWMTAV